MKLPLTGEGAMATVQMQHAHVLGCMVTLMACIMKHADCFPLVTFQHNTPAKCVATCASWSNQEGEGEKGTKTNLVMSPLTLTDVRVGGDGERVNYRLSSA